MSDDGTSGDGDSRLEMFLAVVEKFNIELDDPVETAEEFEELEELDLSEKGLAELPGDLVLSLPRISRRSRWRRTDSPSCLKVSVVMRHRRLRGDNSPSFTSATMSSPDSLQVSRSSQARKSVP